MSVTLSVNTTSLHGGELRWVPTHIQTNVFKTTTKVFFLDKYGFSVLPSSLQSDIYNYVAVPGRNRTLFRCVFRLHYCVQSALVQNFR